MSKSVLGKGLSALIPQGRPLAEKEAGITFVNVERIRQSPHQPRERFNKEKLEELVSSIKEKGVIQPIIVRTKDDNYELIAGERRLRAAKALGINEIPVIIKDVDDAGALELSLIENIQRQELSPVEEAKAFQKLADDFGFSHDDIAKAVGKDRATISNTLRLLGLPRRVQELLADGSISMGHGRALLSLKGEHTILKLANRVMRAGLSVRDVEDIVSRRKAMSQQTPAGSKEADHRVMYFEQELQKALGTKVRIRHKGKKGSIQIEYFSLEDLERIYNFIKNIEVVK